jgi:hypothetical protein
MTDATSFAAMSGKDGPHALARREAERTAPQSKRSEDMDVREWIGGTFRKPEDIGASPIVLTIVSVAKGNYDKLDLTFNDGTKLSLNNTNGRAIARAWGYESDDWIDKQVELSVGLTTYKGEQQESILVKPISPPIPLSGRKGLKPVKPTRKSDPLDDDTPF